MGEPIVDVRDMLCAQALAIVAQAMSGLAPKQMLEIRYDAEDVRRDLTAWAVERGHPLVESGPLRLRLQRRV